MCNVYFVFPEFINILISPNILEIFLSMMDAASYQKLSGISVYIALAMVSVQSSL